MNDGAVEVTLLELNSRRYDLADLLGLLPRKDELRAAAAMGVTVGEIVIDAAAEPPLAKLEALQANNRKFKQSYDRKRPDLQDQSASSYDQSLANLAVEAEWTDQEIVNLLVYSRVKHGDKLKTDRKPADRYYTETIRKAKASLAQARATDVMEEVIAELEDSLDSGNPKAVEESRDNLMDTLRDVLGFRPTRFICCIADDPTFRMEVNGKSIKLGEAGSILEVEVFRKKVAGLLRYVIPLTKSLRAKWGSIAQIILKSCDIVELGDESTEKGAGLNWLRDYLAEKTPLEDPPKEPVTKQPFRDNGEIGLFEDDMRQWLAFRRNEKLSSKALGMTLRECGCEPRPVNFKINGKRTSRSIWFVSRATVFGEESTE
jgi:hypothetical protein